MYWVDMLLGIHSTAVAPRVDVGWTPTATIGVIQTLLGVGGGGLGLRLLANHLLALRKIAEERAARIDDRSDAYTAKISDRVTELESEIAAIRKDHSREMVEERRACDDKLEAMREEVRGMQKRMDGMVRSMIQLQTSEARALPLSPEMQKMIEKIDEVTGREK